MASADLNYIRALLIAQTAEPEPEASGLLGRLFAGKRETRRTPPAPPPGPTARFVASESVNPDQELLLEQIVGPPLDLEVASPLPPPPPRNGFGRRPEPATEAELTLDQLAAEPRRRQVLSPTGHAIGELAPHAEAASVQLVGTVPDETHAAPYFPEDFLESSLPSEPQPMRPWIKALRSSSPGRGDAETFPPEPSVAPVEDPPARTPKKSREGRKVSRLVARTPEPPTPHPAAPGLGHDLLEALALTLTREQETLSDRLLATASDALFVTVAASAG